MAQTTVESSIYPFSKSYANNQANKNNTSFCICVEVYITKISFLIFVAIKSWVIIFINQQL